PHIRPGTRGLQAKNPWLPWNLILEVLHLDFRGVNNKRIIEHFPDVRRMAVDEPREAILNRGQIVGQSQVAKSIPSCVGFSNRNRVHIVVGIEWLRLHNLTLVEDGEDPFFRPGPIGQSQLRRNDFDCTLIYLIVVGTTTERILTVWVVAKCPGIPDRVTRLRILLRWQPASMIYPMQ